MSDAVPRAPDATGAGRGAGRGTVPWTAALTSSTPLPGPGGAFHADIPARIVAHLIDLLVLAVVGVLVAIFVGGPLGGMTTAPTLSSSGGDLAPVPSLIVLLIVLALGLAYFVQAWTALRGTVGMKLLAIEIGDERDGHSIERSQAMVRALLLGLPSVLASTVAYVPSWVGVLLALVGLAWLALLLYTVAQSPTRQGLHDRQARSVLLRSRRRPA